MSSLAKGGRPGRVSPNVVASFSPRQHLAGAVPVLPRKLAGPQQISRPTDSETCSPASAAITFGWVTTRLAQAACPTAAPLVIPARCISQATALYSASSA